MGAYTPQTWHDADPTTPISAARLTHIEAGLTDAAAPANLAIVTPSGNTTAGLTIDTQDTATGSQGVGINCATGGGTAHAHALSAILSGTGNAFSSAANFVSSNQAASCVQVSGSETGRGTVKIAHTGPGTNADANAAALSINLIGASTAAMGVFVDSVAQGTTGDLLRLKNNGNEIFRVQTDAGFTTPIIKIGASQTQLLVGAGAPSGVVSAPTGSLYLNSSGGVGLSLWIKETGSGTSGWAVLGGTLNAKSYGAKGDGSTDDTTALTAWVTAINAASAGSEAILPAGQYVITAPLPTITATGVTIRGSGWAQTANTTGSVITAGVGWSGTAILTLNGEGIELRGLTIDAANRATSAIVITAANCRLNGMSARSSITNGVVVDVQTGGNSIWMADCRINGINSGVVGIQINDTDAIIHGCKPVNCLHCIVLLAGASGAQLMDNHMTPGAGGQCCVFVSGSPSHVQMDGNRFDNYVRSAVQITPTASTPNSISITNNHFHSTIQTDNTYALIALDTTASGVRGLHIVGNSGYGSATNRPKWALASQVIDGTTPTNVTRLSTLGSLYNSNTMWAATTSFGNASPLVARGNLTTTDGTTYAAVTDI